MSPTGDAVQLAQLHAPQELESGHVVYVQRGGESVAVEVVPEQAPACLRFPDALAAKDARRLTLLAAGGFDPGHCAGQIPRHEGVGDGVVEVEQEATLATPVLIRQGVRLEVGQVDIHRIELMLVSQFDEGVVSDLLAPPVGSRWHRQAELEILRLSRRGLCTVDVDAPASEAQSGYVAQLLRHQFEGVACPPYSIKSQC